MIDKDEIIIIDQSRFVLLKTDQLVKATWNYKEDNEELKEKLKANLKRNGQLENIVVRKLDTGFYEIVNGNHRYDAIVELGVTEVMCYDLGEVSDAHAMRIAVELNETRFGTNDIKLAQTIKIIGTEFDLSDLANSMPYSLEQLGSMIELTSFDFNQYNPDPAPPEGDGKRLIVDMTQELSDRWKSWKIKAGAGNDIEGLTKALDQLLPD